MRSRADAAVGRHVHVVLGERQRLGEQVADAGLVVDHEDARTRRAGRGARRCRRAGRRRATPPRSRWLSSQASMSRLRKRHWRPTRTAGNLPRFDQPVDRSKVDLEVFQDFFGREKRFVNHR